MATPINRTLFHLKTHGPSDTAALASALESIDKAAQEIDNAAASLDDARLESTED